MIVMMRMMTMMMRMMMMIYDEDDNDHDYRLRVLLHPVNLDTDPDAPNFNNDVVLATLIDDTLDHWKEAQVLYTYPEEHTVRCIHVGKCQTSVN